MSGQSEWYETKTFRVESLQTGLNSTYNDTASVTSVTSSDQLEEFHKYNAMFWLAVLFFSVTHLRHRLLYIRDDETDVVGENSVQRLSPLTVLSQHEKTNILLCWDWAAHV